MDKAEFVREVDLFLLEVRAKLMRGWDQWRDSNAGSMTPDQIMGEVSDELVDVLGWSFWLWRRFRHARPALTTPPPR